MHHSFLFAANLFGANPPAKGVGRCARGRVSGRGEGRNARCAMRLGQRQGFTLIELMVAIGIIGVLAAIIFPVFRSVKQTGQVTVCSNNMKQLGLAFQQYLQDNAGRYPGAGQYQKWANGGHWVGADLNGDNATGQSSGTFVSMTDVADPVGQPYTGAEARIEKGALYPYVKNPGIYVCPAEPNAEYKRLTYSMNCAIGGLNATTRMRKPVEVVLLVDENNANDGYFWAFDATGAGYPGPSTDALSQNHRNGGNLLFCDGHVRFYSFNAFPLGSENKIPASVTSEKSVSGTPRFYDGAFGASGYYVSPVPTPPPVAKSPFGSCALPDS